MARFQDIRNGTVVQSFNTYHVHMEDGSVKNYQVATQPMPTVKLWSVGQVRFSKPSRGQAARAVSKHLKGWQPGPSCQERRTKRRMQRQARKIQRSL